MNYFEFYEIPLSFHPDVQALSQKFYQLSKKYHPDFYINSSTEEQEKALELATLNNKAFQVLKDPKQLLKYILQLKELIHDGEHYVLPQSFLMDMMEVNEAIMDLQFDVDEQKKAILTKQVSDIANTIEQELLALTRNFDQLDTEQQNERLLQIKDVFYRDNYVRRLKQSIQKLS